MLVVSRKRLPHEPIPPTERMLAEDDRSLNSFDVVAPSESVRRNHGNLARLTRGKAGGLYLDGTGAE